MISSVFKFGFQFVFLVLLQALVLNNVHAFNFATAYFYVLFIILLPVEYNKNLVLLLAFVLGLSVDLFSSSWGLHAFSSVFAAYLRPLVLRFLAPRDGYEFNSKPNWSTMGFSWFFTYAAIMVFIHHFTLQLLEAFRLSEMLSVFWRTLGSALFTLLLVFIAQLFVYKPNRST